MGSIGPLLVTVCTNQNRYSDPHLRSAATLALAKFMLVRYVPGHTYTKNLYSYVLRNEIILSLVKKKITLKKGVQAFQIFKFINTLYLSMTIIFILSKVSLTTNNQVWSFAIQKYPFLSVVVYFPAQSSVRVTFSCCSLFWRNRLTPQYEPTQSLLLGI